MNKGTIAVLAAGLMTWSAAAQEDHSQHQGHEHHTMTPAQFEELRAKIDLYKDFTDDQIMESMSRMRNSGGMISEAGVVGDVGILALAHGYTDQGNAQWKSRFEPVAAEYPVGYGLGMAMMGGEHIQQAVDGLEAAGAKRILILRTETGDDNSLTRQWEYLFGRRDEASYLAGTRVSTDAEIIWGPSPTAHPIMGEIMLDHALQLSSDPANEMVVIMGHGPMTDDLNKKDLEILAKHAAYIKEQGGFADVKYGNVQDDLPKPQRQANVDRIRGWILDAKAEGMNVIVVTNALTQSGIMGRLKADVDGTGAAFNDTGLMQNDRFADWIRAAIEENVPSE